MIYLANSSRTAAKLNVEGGGRFQIQLQIALQGQGLPLAHQMEALPCSTMVAPQGPAGRCHVNSMRRVILFLRGPLPCFCVSHPCALHLLFVRWSGR